MWKHVSIIGICFLATALRSEAFQENSKVGSWPLNKPYNHPVLDQLDQGEDVTEEFITQRLDHFDRQNRKTFKMRYLRNEQYAMEGSPILIYLGGEWTITKEVLLKSHVRDIAKEMNALMIYLEHRYYGESRPTRTLTTENLKYLTADQALADIAHFIGEIQKTPRYAHSPVILVGASYAGTLAVWFRQKYPHLVVGAWASSAPILAKVDFKEYKELVGQTFALIAGYECTDKIQRAFGRTEELFRYYEFDKIQKKFNLCRNSNPGGKLNVWSFFSKLSHIFSVLAEKHRPGHIRKVCDILTANTTTDEELVRKLGYLFKYYLNGLEKCIDVTYDTTVQSYLNTNYTENNKRLWKYQACSEFGWFQTSSSEQQPFGTKFPLDFNVRLCEDIFDEEFTKYTIADNIEGTNNFYGGLNPAVTNVIFTHGELDPWHVLGIREDLNRESLAIVIRGASHCHDLSQIDQKLDSAEMLEAKITIRDRIKSWIYNI